VNTLKLCLSFAVAFALSACGGGGGGGGGSTTPPPAPVPFVTFLSGSVSPAQNAVGVSPQATLSAEFNVINADTLTPSGVASLTCNGNVQVSFQASVTALSLPQGSTGKQWKVSAVPVSAYPLGLPCSGALTVTVGGVTQSQNIAFTVNSVFAYSDKVYVTYIGAYPYSVTKTGVTKVTNKTQFTTGFFPLANCSLYETPIENGIIPVQCTTASDNVRRTFYINPTTNELFQYTGTFVFDSAKWHDVAWGTTTPYGANVGRLGWYAEVSDGIYWGSALSDQKLRFSPKVGNGYDFNNPLIVAQGTGVDFFKVIIKYSH
jgi:hypothetical protein